MPQTVHEDLLNRVAPELSTVNQAFAVHGTSAAYASATNVATWQAVNNAYEASAAIHESDKAIFQVANRSISEANQQGIFTNTKIAAANTQALAQAGFTSEDSSLPAGYSGNRG